MSENEITLHGNFWPTLWYIDLGGNVHFDLTVTYSGTPPASYDYQVFLKDYEGNIVKTWSDTKSTGGQAETQVKVAWDGRNAGEKIPYKPMRFYAEVTDSINALSASGGFCSGVHPQPGPGPVPEPPSETDPPVEPPVPPEVVNPPDPYIPIPPPDSVDPPGPGEDEVHMFAGALTANIVDLSIPDLGIPLVIERYYHSLGTTMQQYSSRFATCMFNFEEQIGYDETDNSYTVIFPNRSLCRFVKQGNNYTASGDNNYNTLEDGPDGTRILTFKNGWKHWFDGDGKLIRIVNRTGQSVIYEWLESHMASISRITGPSGRSLEFTYVGEDFNNSEIIITDWTGRTLKYQITEGCISQKTDPEGNVFTYLENGDTFTGLESISPPNGTILTNDCFGGSPLGVHVKTQVPGVGADFNYEFDWDNYRTTVTRGDRQWEYHFDTAKGLLEKTIDPMGYERSYTRDEKGNITGYTDAQGRTTTYTWDENGNMTSVTDFQGNTTTYEYNDYGQMTKRTAPGDRITEWEYDETTGNLLSMTDPEEREATYEYYNNGLLQKSTDVCGIVSEYDYDNYGNITKIGNGNGTIAQYEYDSIGNQIKEISPDGEESCFEYDKNGNLLKNISADGEETSYQYDGNSNLIKTIYSDGSEYSTTFNVMSDATSSTGADGSQDTYEYDEYRQLTKVNTSSGSTIQYEYDKLGRKTKETDSSGSVWEIDYASNSDTTEIDANGKVTRRIYDSDGSLLKIIYNDGSYHQYTYDQHRTIITQPGERYGEIRYGGNDYGSQTYGSEKYGGSGAKYGFDPENNIEKFYDKDTGNLMYVKYPRDKFVSYSYDDEEKTSTVTDIRGYATTRFLNVDSQIFKVTYRGEEILYSYDSEDRISTVTLPNGIVKTMTYQNTTGDTVKRIKYEKDSDLLYQLDMEYYDDGNVKSRTISKVSGYQKIHSFLFDSDSRKIGIYCDGKPGVSYVYDSGGKLVQKRESDGKIIDYHYDSKGQASVIGGESYKYDNNGNVTEKHIITKKNPSRYVYDNENNLAMVILPEGYTGEENPDPLGLYVWRYRYYPSGETGKKISPSGRELRFYYDSGRILNEEGWFRRTPKAEDGYKLPKGSEEDRVTHIVSWVYGVETTPIAIDTTPAHSGPNEKCINYYLTDEEDSIIALTDSFGNIVKWYEYDEEGKRTEIPLETSMDNPHTGYNPVGKNGEIIDSERPIQISANLSINMTDEELLQELANKIKYKTFDELHGYRKKFGGKIGYICHTHAVVYSNKNVVANLSASVPGVSIQKAYVVGRYPQKDMNGKINKFEHTGVVYKIKLHNGNIVYFYQDYNDDVRLGKVNHLYYEWWYKGQSKKAKGGRYFSINKWRIAKNKRLYNWDKKNYLEKFGHYTIGFINTYFPVEFDDTNIDWASNSNSQFESKDNKKRSIRDFAKETIGGDADDIDKALSAGGGVK